MYFWYVHNLNERNNPVVSEELNTMASNANSTVKINFPDNEVEVFAVEVGNETIEKWYTSSNKFIALTDKFDVETPNAGFEEFEAFPNYFYSGGRRGELNPYRSKEIFDPYLVAQSLLSFHGDCVTAYNSKNELWNDDKLYSNIFSEQLTASHIIFVYALLRAIDSYKLELHSKGSERTEVEGKQYTFLSKRGSKMLLIYTIAKCMEGIIGKRIVNSWGLVFKDTNNFESLYKLWLKVVKSVLPMSYSLLENVLVEGLKNKEKAETAADSVVGMFAAIQEMVRIKVEDFIDNIEVV